ncbi:MAG TPA: TlpA disulfide reductase family protein [Gemmatimonadales bacterium]|nr:TlpA disulfide reductase family protein [Gemmatimonadales bacterium]
MSSRRQWTAVISIVMAIVFAIALAIKLRPEIVLVGVGSRAPEFQAVDLATNRPAKLSDYRGRVLLLNIWATWCEPCRIEMPAIERLQQHLGANPAFRILSVSIDADGPEVVRNYAREMGLTFDILQDRPGTIRSIYQTTGVPESFVIDRNGTIVKKVIGAAAWDSPVNENLIQGLIDGR